MRKLAAFAIRFRWTLILVFLALAFLMGSEIQKGRFNSDLLSYLPSTLPSRVSQQRIEEQFGGTELIMLIVENDDVVNAHTLERVRHFTEGMQNIPGIERVYSLFTLKNIRSEEDAMLVDPAVSSIPRSPGDIAGLKHALEENEQVYGSIVAKDWSATSIVGVLGPGVSDKNIVDAVEKIVEKYSGDDRVLLGGSPYMRVQNAGMMQRDMVRLIPLGLLLMVFFLFLDFRQWRGVWLSFIIVLMSLVFALGATPLLGWQYAITTVILVVLLIATANSYGIHMFACYQRYNTEGSSITRRELATRMLTELGTPIFLSALTTIAGLLCMQGHIIIPGQQMGVLGAIGIGVALIGSILFVPAVSAVLPKTKPIYNVASGLSSQSSWVDGFLRLVGRMVTHHPKAILLSFIALFIMGVLGILQLSPNSNPLGMYPEEHPARIGTELINAELGGFFPLYIIFEGDIRDPEQLMTLDSLERRIRLLPEVGATQSIARVTRQISRAVYSKGEEGYNRIPKTREGVAQLFELYLMGGEQEDWEKMVDFDFSKALLSIRFKELKTPVLRERIAQIRDMVKGNPRITAIGGNSDVFSDMDRHVLNGQYLSLVFALIVVFIILSLGFRSIRAGLLQIVPLVFAMVMLFGLMGYFGIELNFMTAFQASVLIGVGVDYTIHVVWRLREQRRLRSNEEQAVQGMLQAAGRGLVFNALDVIVGFSVLLFSGFLPVRFFGIMMVTIIFVCLIASLLLVPSLCMVFRPKFLR